MIFNLMIKLHFIKLDSWVEQEGNSEDPFIISIEPRWFFQKKRVNNEN